MGQNEPWQIKRKFFLNLKHSQKNKYMVYKYIFMGDSPVSPQTMGGDEI